MQNIFVVFCFILFYFIYLFYFYFIVLNNYKWEKWGRRRKKKTRIIFIISSHSSPITLTHSTLSPSIIYIHIFIVALHCIRLSSAIGLSNDNCIINHSTHISITARSSIADCRQAPPYHCKFQFCTVELYRQTPTPIHTHFIH